MRPPAVIADVFRLLFVAWCALTLWGLPQRAEAVTWNNSTVSGATGNQFNVVVTDVTNSTFIAGDANGNVYVSNDFGVAFTRQANLTGAVAINDLAYSAAEGVTIAVRADGSIWTNTELILPADPTNPGTVGWTETQAATGTALNAVTFDGTNAVAVGNNGVLFYSTDKGQTWTAGSTSSGYAQNLNDVSLSGTASIAVGERDGMQDYDNIFYSSGFGGTWNLATIPAPGGMDDAANFEVIDYNGTYAIAGSAKNMDEGTTVIFRSTDNGVNWTKVNLTGSDDETVRDLRLSGSTAILVTEKQMGDGEIWRSTDSGVNWTDVGDPDEDLFAVTLVGTKSYAVGDMGEAGESTDTGANWDFSAATGTGDLQDVEYNTLGDRVVAAGAAGDIIYSSATVNLPPYITSNNGTSVASISVVENTTAVTDVDATDPDVDGITFSINTGVGDWDDFSIVPATGVLTFLLAPDFENPTDIGGDNTYVVIVSATDLSGSGNSDTQTLNVTVTDDPGEVANNAPVLDNSGTPALTAVNEDNAAPGGDTIAALIATGAGGDPITDADAGALEGIAVIAVDNTNGAWEYSTNAGGSWNAFGTPTTAAARLLGADSPNNLIRFVPSANYNGSVDPGITFHAWDQTTGANGTTANVTTNGGTTAYSTATETASITVTAVNDAPVNSVPSAQATNENTTLTFSTGNGNLISIADADVGGSNLQITLTITNGTATLNGTAGLSFTTGNGTADASMVFTGTLAAINTALDGLDFDPTPGFNGAASLQIQTSDQGNTGSGGTLTDDDTIAITVNAVNDAPVLDNSGTPALTAVNEDETNPAGITIAALIATGAGGDPITDVDAGALEGIAVIAVYNTNGTWQYSTNAGGTWSAFGTPTTAAARLLGADSVNNLIRFVPSADYNGSVDPGITFHAWDQTTGANGATANVTTNGGTTAYSTTTETASIAVNAVNDAPLLFGLESAQITYVFGDPATQLSSTINVSDVDNVNIASATVQITSNLDVTDVLEFTNTGSITGSYNAGTGLMSLSGNTTLANYRDALRAVTFRNTNAVNPSALTRTVSFQVSDGAASSNVQTRNIAFATPPNIGIAPNPISFGNVTLGSDSTRTVTISNSGGAPLTVTSITSSDAQFVATSPALPFNVGAGGSTTITVTFSPVGGGSAVQNANLTVTSNTGNVAGTNTVVPMSGLGTLQITPSSLDFGIKTLFSSSTLQLTINNTTGALVTINTVGSSNSQFTNQTPLPLAIPDGTTGQLDISYFATSDGTTGGQLSISYNPTITVDVIGCGGYCDSTPSSGPGEGGASEGGDSSEDEPFTVPFGGETYLLILVAGYGIYALSRAKR